MERLQGCSSFHESLQALLVDHCTTLSHYAFLVECCTCFLLAHAGGTTLLHVSNLGLLLGHALMEDLGVFVLDM